MTNISQASSPPEKFTRFPWEDTARQAGAARELICAKTDEGRGLAAAGRLADVRDRALLLLGFAGAFRRSELVALDTEDIEETKDGLRAP
jgi:integrase